MIYEINVAKMECQDWSNPKPTRYSHYFKVEVDQPTFLATKILLEMRAKYPKPEFEVEMYERHVSYRAVHCG